MHAHRLRHTAATAMLRAGSPLAEVGQVLRHRAPLTTAIYAKVDRDALPVLARPWPPTDGRWPVMTAPLREALADYLALRRALGYRLARPEKLLNQFLDHLDADRRHRRSPSTRRWTGPCLPAGGDSNWWAYRLSVVRGFATYLHALDPAHEVPAADLLPRRAAAGQPVLVFRRRHRRADRRDRVAAHPAAARDVRDADRAAGRDRDAGR